MSINLFLWLYYFNSGTQNQQNDFNQYCRAYIHPDKKRRFLDTTISNSTAVEALPLIHWGLIKFSCAFLCSCAYEIETQAETETETQVETEMETETQVEMETETQAETETETEMQADTETEMQAETETETETQRRRRRQKRRGGVGDAGEKSET